MGHEVQEREISHKQPQFFALPTDRWCGLKTGILLSRLEKISSFCSNSPYIVPISLCIYPLNKPHLNLKVMQCSTDLCPTFRMLNDPNGSLGSCILILSPHSTVYPIIMLRHHNASSFTIASLAVRLLFPVQLVSFICGTFWAIGGQGAPIVSSPSAALCSRSTLGSIFGLRCFRNRPQAEEWSCAFDIG